MEASSSRPRRGLVPRRPGACAGDELAAVLVSLVRDCSPGLPCNDRLTLADTRSLGLTGLTFVTAADPLQGLLAR